MTGNILDFTGKKTSTEIDEAKKINARKEVCSKCRFWAESRMKTDEGTCRKYTPKVFPINSNIGVQFLNVWPGARNDDWCGEFQEKVSDGT